MALLQKFEHFVASRRLYDGNKPMLIALSGGLDSVVLAHLWRASGRAAVLAHCNFGLRGEASGGDEAWVRALAEAWQTPFLARRFETAAYAETAGISIQMAARDLRYGWFADLLQEGDYAGVATGHHLQDAVETALLHWTRGTGLSGLTGIPVRNDAIVRPLLFATRDQILQYAEENELTWREDASNASDIYDRNYLRLHVLPHIEKLNPGFWAGAARSLQILTDTRDNYRFLLQQYAAQAAEWDEGVQRFDIAALRSVPAPAALLYDLLHIHGFTADQLAQLAENLDRTGFELHSPAGVRLLVDRSHLLVTRYAGDAPEPLRIEADDLLLRLRDGSRLILSPTTLDGPFPDGRMEIKVDAEKIKFPLLLRPWKNGDVFHPLGMDGRRQKLQDFFTNQKLSRHAKAQVLVLENADGAIIWVLGLRPDERFKIAPATRSALRFAWMI
ncbi:MAG: hypothetical protein RL742_1693 [Bacteroidota bacterium]